MALFLILFVPGIGVMILPPFYSNWVLGAIAGNFVGLPTNKDVMSAGTYWAYFIVNLIPFAAL
jgi:hypothetical protein